jgi:hypothetical protein
MWPFLLPLQTKTAMHTLSDFEAEEIGGGFTFALPAIQVSPNIIINTVPQINAGSAIAVLGGNSSLDQNNGSSLWNALIAGLFSF